MWREAAAAMRAERRCSPPWGREVREIKGRRRDKEGVKMWGL